AGLDVATAAARPRQIRPPGGGGRAAPPPLRSVASATSVRAGFIDHVTILIRDYARARLSVRIIAHRASHRSDHSAARPATEGSGYRYKTAKTRSRYEMKIWE